LNISYARWFAQPLAVEILFWSRISIGLYAACGVVCVLGIITSWRYWRSHEMASPGGVISFSLYFGWLVTWSVLSYLNNVVMRANPLFKYASNERIWFWSATLLVFVALWSACLRRLARAASTMPRIRRSQR
jgi:hypothetical protein